MLNRHVNMNLVISVYKYSSDNNCKLAIIKKNSAFIAICAHRRLQKGSKRQQYS